MATILIADDDADIRDLVEFKLASLGHDVIAVAHGAAAIDACKESLPDLAVLDVMMPGVTGVEVVRILRADPATVGLPIILLSGRAEQSQIEAALACGATDYLTKPFSPRELASRVDAILTASA
jgi:two-component system, OmpR family, response regulator MtrA